MAALCGALLPPVDAQNNAQVIVIGAGVAGLKAAADLQAAGRTVIVLEARNRPYGRVDTQQPEGWPIPIELGAQWFHSSPTNVVYQYAKNLPASAGLQIVSTGDGEDEETFRGSSIIPAADENKYQGWFDAFEDYLANKQESASDAASKKLTLEQVITDFMKTRNIAAGSADERGFRSKIESNYVQEYAASTGELSAVWFDQGADYVGDDNINLTGYQKVFAGMYASLKQAVRLGMEVTSITWSTNSVQATVKALNKATGATETFTSSYVICTLPVGVLQAKRTTLFPQGLPSARTAAINAMGIGLLNKVIMEFPQNFWSAEVDNAQWIANIPSSYNGMIWAEFFSLAEATDKNILVAFLAGNSAFIAEDKSDEELKASVMAVLRTMFAKGDVPVADPTRYVVTRWSKDPYALMAYSYMKTGATGSTRKNLCSTAAGSKQQVWFAGEHCSVTYPSTVQGAWLTGQSAAKSVISRLPAGR